MKKNLFITFLIFQISLFSFTAKAAEITAIDFLGNVIGKVLPDAKVINLENNIIGSINVDGQIINLEGDIIGGIAPQGVAISNDFRVLGRPNQDGEVVSPSGKALGKVLPNSLVINEAFEVIGAVLFPGIVYSDEGEYIGRLSGDGQYTNIEGKAVGFVTPDGYAYKKIADDYILDGKLISSKMALSLQGGLIGSLSPDGSVQNFNGKTIGKVAANGYIYDKNKQAIAKIAKNAYAFDEIGNPIGFITYDGKVSSKDSNNYQTFYNNTIVDDKLKPIGFSLSTTTTATDLKGNFLGIVLPTGAVIKGSETKGFISSRGIVLSKEGNIIGKTITTGPVMNYKSDLISHALYNGSTYNLNGVSNGYIKNNNAHDSSGKIVGRISSPKVVFSNSNSFLGLSGLTSKLNINQKNIMATMFGYAFDEEGKILGQSLGLDFIYNQQGSLIGLITAQGIASSFSQVSLGYILGMGYVVDELNKTIGKTFIAQYSDKKNLSDFLISQTNALLNKGGKTEAKILPDNSIIKSANQTSVDLMPQIASAYDDIMVVSYDGTLQGYVDYDNYIRDFSNAKIGSIFAGGIAVDNNGLPIGETITLAPVLDQKCFPTSVLNHKAEARNFRNVLQGRAYPRGFIISDSTVSGYTAKRGSIIDINGNIVGYASNNGQAYNAKNESLGCINSQGRIRKNGVIVGAVVEFLPAIDFQNQIIGRSIIDGKVINSNSLNIGYIQPSTGVVSSSGDALGLLLKYKYAFDDNNNFMGLVDEKAQVISSDSEVVGKVLYDGTVIKKDGKEQGFALYDLYVYDKDFNPMGYINFSGQVKNFNGESLGSMKRGFLVDAKDNVIARANRDYFIRNDKYIVLGELKLNGDLLNSKGQKLGSINKIGEVIDESSVVIAKARPLQYYSNLNVAQKRTAVIDQDGNIIGYVDDFGNVYDLEGNKIGKKDNNGNVSNIDGKTIGKVLAKEPVYNQKGEKIGTTNPDGTVVDINGKVIGTLNEKGEVIDASGNIIGGIGKNWYKKTEPQKPTVQEPEIKDYIKSISIALTPDGQYLGEILEDGSVVDKNGQVLGKKQPDGLVIDDQGALIGIEEVKKTTSEEIFVPSGTFGPGGAYGIGNAPIDLGPGGGYGPNERYSQARSRALAMAQSQRRQSSSVGGIKSKYNPSSFDYMQDNWGGDVDSDLSTWRVDMSEMILADKPIPAVLARSVYNTSTEVPVTAFVERNVYSEEGRNIIIPAGSRLIGSVGGFGGAQGVSTNATKVQITWERLIRPDGSMFKLSGSVTGDSQGRQGALGYVDDQLAQKYVQPLVEAALTTAIAYNISSDEESTGEVESSGQEAANDARENFLEAMNNIFGNAMDAALEDQKLIFVPAGTRITVYPKKDLWLRNPERDLKSNEYSDEDGKAVSLVDNDRPANAEGVANPANTSTNQTQTTNGQVVYNNQNGAPAQQSSALVGTSTPQQAPPRTDILVAPPPPSSTGATTQTPTAPTSNSSVPVLF